MVSIREWLLFHGSRRSLILTRKKLPHCPQILCIGFCITNLQKFGNVQQAASTVSIISLSYYTVTTSTLFTFYWFLSVVALGELFQFRTGTALNRWSNGKCIHSLRAKKLTGHFATIGSNLQWNCQKYSSSQLWKIDPTARLSRDGDA